MKGGANMSYEDLLKAEVIFCSTYNDYVYVVVDSGILYDNTMYRIDKKSMNVDVISRLVYITEEVDNGKTLMELASPFDLRSL